MGFKPWISTSKRGFSPKASIRRNGHIGFNYGSVARYDLKNSRHVKLFYDEDERKIGILTHVNEDEPGALHLNTKGANAYVSAKNFLDHHALDYSVTATGDLLQETTEFGDLLVLSLETMKKRNSSARPSSRSAH